MFNFFRKKKKMSMRRNNLNNINDCTNINNLRNILQEGDEGDDVKKLQNMLMSITHICPTLPQIKLDGKYTSNTRTAVEVFQSMMGINNTGVVDNNTWEKLNLIYNKKDDIKGVEKIEFNNITKEIKDENDLNNNILKEGSKGEYVFRLQEYLKNISSKNNNIPSVPVNGIFESRTKNAVMCFQEEYGIDISGEVDSDTWDKIYNESIK